MGATDLSVLPQRSVVFPETVFRGLAPADVPLRVEGVVGQTGNLQEWKTSTGSVRLAVNQNGSIISNWGYYGAGIETTTPAAIATSTGDVANIGIVVRAVAGQTANLQEWRNSSGTPLAFVNSSGLIRTNRVELYDENSGIMGGPGNRMQLFAYHGVVIQGGQAVQGAPAGMTGYASSDPSLVVFSPRAGQRTAVFQQAAAPSVNNTEWTSSTGAALAAVDSLGGFLSASNTPQIFTSVGTGTYNKTVVYHNSSGLVFEMARTTDSAGANQIPFQINRRGGDLPALTVNAVGDVVIDRNLIVAQNTSWQGDPSRGLRVGNDLWIYDVNIGNAIGFSGVGNPEAATIYLGRTSNVAPRVSGNDVNKTLVLAGDNAGGASQVIIGSIAINGGTPQLTLQGQGGATSSNHTNFLRFEGLGVRHGEVTWHPAESYFRFRTTSGSAFDGWAYLLANQFYAQSTEASKENIQTVDLAGHSGVQEIRREAKTGAPESPLSERFKSLRPVSYRSKGDPNSPLHHSFVAEEAFESVPEIVAIDGDGKPAGINLMATISILTAMVQDQQKKIEALEARVA